MRWAQGSSQKINQTTRPLLIKYPDPELNAFKVQTLLSDPDNGDRKGSASIQNLQSSELRPIAVDTHSSPVAETPRPRTPPPLARASRRSFSTSSSWSPILVPRCFFRYIYLSSYIYIIHITYLVINILIFFNLWIGEGMAVISVIKRCVQRRPDATVLMTTTTLSAL